MAASNPSEPPRLTVLDGYAGQAAFVAARKDSQEELPQSWLRYVVKPYLNRCAGGGDYFELAQAMLLRPITDLAGLESEIAQLRQNDAEVHQAVDIVFEKAEKLLPAPDTRLCVFAADPEFTIIRDMGGVGGLTAGAGKIIFQVRPDGHWKDWLPFSFAHEYHHSAWTALHTDDLPVFDLANYLVFEGRADSFAHIIFPQQVAAWDKALSPEQEAAAWKQMQGDLGSPDMMAERRYMFGGQGVPHWAGYTVGFHIVQAYLHTHPKATVEDWTKLNSHALINQSGYNP